MSSDILKLDGNKLTGAKKGSAVATFNMGDDVQTSAVIRVGGDTTSLVCPPDITIETNDKTIEDGFSFAVYGNTIKKNSLVERLVAKRLAGTLNKSELDTVLFLSDTSYIPNGFDKTVLSSSEYMIKNFGDTTIITMDNKKSPKWEELISALKSSSSKNIFIALSETINDDGGYYEEMLIDIMQKHLKNKNVYVLSPDGDLAIYDTGIKHIQTPGAESIKDISVVADHIGYLKITVLGDKFNIERVKIFE